MLDVTNMDPREFEKYQDHYRADSDQARRTWNATVAREPLSAQAKRLADKAGALARDLRNVTQDVKDDRAAVDVARAVDAGMALAARVARAEREFENGKLDAILADAGVGR